MARTPGIGWSLLSALMFALCLFGDNLISQTGSHLKSTSKSHADTHTHERQGNIDSFFYLSSKGISTLVHVFGIAPDTAVGIDITSKIAA